MNAENIVNKESDSETNNARTSRHYSSKEEIRIRKQQGMNEDAVKKLCPGTYNKYKKKNGDTGP